MNLTRITILATTALTLVPGTAHARTPDELELTGRWTKAYNEADPVTLAGLYSDDAELYIHNGGRFIGQEAIAA